MPDTSGQRCLVEIPARTILKLLLAAALVWSLISLVDIILVLVVILPIQRLTRGGET